MKRRAMPTGIVVKQASNEPCDIPRAGRETSGNLSRPGPGTKQIATGLAKLGGCSCHGVDAKYVDMNPSQGAKPATPLERAKS